MLKHTLLSEYLLMGVKEKCFFFSHPEISEYPFNTFPHYVASHTIFFLSYFVAALQPWNM